MERRLPNYSYTLSQEYGKVAEHQHKPLQDLVKHHIESFDFFLERGLGYAVQDLPTLEVQDPQNRKISFFIEDATIGHPTVPESNVYSRSVKIFPAECRERGASYKAKMSVTICWKVDGKAAGTIDKFVGQVPIMVKSSHCRLANLSPKDLVKHHEEAEEMGGYFIVNGNERLIRMLIMPRRNYPIAISRPSWKARGALYTEYGIQIRSVRKDQSSSNYNCVLVMIDRDGRTECTVMIMSLF